MVVSVGSALFNPIINGENLSVFVIEALNLLSIEILCRLMSTWASKNVIQSEISLCSNLLTFKTVKWCNINSFQPFNVLQLMKSGSTNPGVIKRWWHPMFWCYVFLILHVFRGRGSFIITISIAYHELS